MINLSWETVAGQLDMPLAGKLVLSAAAAAFLLALAFRFYKSRMVSKSELPRTESEELSASTNNGKENTQKRPTRGATNQTGTMDPRGQVPEMRHRQVTRIVMSQSARKNNGCDGKADGAVNLESCRPSNEGHEQNNLASTTEDLEASKEEDPQCATSKAQSVIDGQVGTGIALPKSHNSVQDEGQEKSCSGVNQKLFDQANAQPVVNLPMQQEVKDPFAAENSQTPPHGKHDIYPKKEPNIDDALNYLAASLDRDTRKEPEGGEINNSHLNVNEAAAPRDGVRKVKASSGIDLTINRRHNGASRLYSTFSSIAEVEVEESLIKGHSGKCDKPAQKLPPAVLRGKVYKYYAEHNSESVSNERSFSSKPAGTQSPAPRSQEFKDQFKSPTRSHLIQNKVCGNSTEANASTDEIMSPADDKESLDVGTLKGALHAQDSCQLPENQLPPKEDLIMTENPKLQHAIASSVTSSSPVIMKHQEDVIPDHVSPMLKSVDPTHHKPSTKANIEPASEFDNSLEFQIFQRDKDPFLDLGNCYAALKKAKEKDLDDLKEAAYKFMSDNYLQVLQTPAIYGHLNATERELILDKRMKGRRYMVVADVDTQTHTPPSYRASSRLCYFDNDGGSWHKISCLPPEAVTAGCAMGTMFNYLFVVAGCEGPGRQRKPSNRVFCYNPLNGDWKEICPLNQARPHCKLVELKGCLYAIGGECQRTMELYDPRRDRWNFATPLPNDTFAIAHMATVCEDKIYVTGGTLRYMLLSYEPREQLWRSSLISGSRDRTTELVAVGSFIYRFDLNRSIGISVHRCNVRARLWYECASHRVPYPASFQCAVIGNHIHCLNRQFHLRFLADDISPRFLDGDLERFPSPGGGLFPFVLQLPYVRALPPQKPIVQFLRGRPHVF